LGDLVRQEGVKDGGAALGTGPGLRRNQLGDVLFLGMRDGAVDVFAQPSGIGSQLIMARQGYWRRDRLATYERAGFRAATEHA